MERNPKFLRKSLLSLALLAALPLAPGAAWAAGPPAEGSAASAEAPAPGAEVVWLSSLSQALAEAKKRDAYILVDLYADWCGWCKQLEKKVFSTPEFAAKAKSFVLLRVDTDHDEDGAKLQALHEASSLPNTLLLDAKGVRVGQISGYAPTREFLGYIDQQLQAWNDLKANYPGLLAEGDAETQLEVAKELHKRQDGERAAALYEAVSKRIDPNTSSYVWIQYMLADTYRIDRRFDLAEKAIERTRTLLSHAEDSATLGEQLDLLRYYIAQDNGDCRGARSTLEQFLTAHPASELRPRLQKTLNELRLDAKCT